MPPYARALAWLASLAHAGGDRKATEAYLVQLLSWLVFSEREINTTDD